MLNKSLFLYKLKYLYFDFNISEFIYKIKFVLKFLQKVVIFQNFNYIVGFYFYNFLYSSGVLIHISLGFLNKIFFNNTPKKKNIKILSKIYVYLINTCLYRVFVNNNIKKKSIINKSFFKIKNLNTILLNVKKLKRLNKKKRSLKRKSRKKIFTSLFGRIWLT